MHACRSTLEDPTEAAVVVEGSGPEARLVAYVVNDVPPSLLELKRRCAERLPRYMIIDRVRYLSEMPRTSTGKVDRAKLARSFAGHVQEMLQ